MKVLLIEHTVKHNLAENQIVNGEFDSDGHLAGQTVALNVI